MESREGRVWGVGGPQLRITAAFSKGTDLHHLETNHNGERFLSVTLRLAAVLSLTWLARSSLGTGSNRIQPKVEGRT